MNWSRGLLTGQPSIPVIDLFAGPGGLGEGFNSYRTRNGENPFKIILSIEKDTQAHKTLQLRSFLRQFGDRFPDQYYQSLADINVPLSKRIEKLFSHFPTEAKIAKLEAWRTELGKESRSTVRKRIATALGRSEPWVLIGGPPCQAYSIAGRSRNKGRTDYKSDEDARQFLYVEYLQVIAEHSPSIFVMENVKGLLSATVREQRIFDRILDDLQDPIDALRREQRNVQPTDRRRSRPRYEIFSLSERDIFNDDDLQDFVVRMEDHGIPQARHRLILLGVRTNLLGSATPAKLKKQRTIPTRKVLEGLPKLRSGLSREEDNLSRWIEEVQKSTGLGWFNASAQFAGFKVHQELIRTVESMTLLSFDRGSEFIPTSPSIGYKPSWYLDRRMNGVCNHSSRSHIVSDLYRYLFAACFGSANKRSPVLAEFPRDLLPNHQNVKNALRGNNFADRFRVQLADRPSTTITSHIAKDGHYYIHYDPTQCRSLTVREAARLQTFPDNYFFCGPRTSQYAQVGNAVPPLLARQIAAIVFKLLSDTGAIN